MKEAVEGILKAHRLFTTFDGATDFAVRITNDPYMPLTIERHMSGKLTFVTLTHYFEQNGDLVADPDMEFVVQNGLWLPMAIQFATGHYKIAIQIEEDEWKINQSEAKAQVDFATMWATNLLEQGFEKGQAEVIS